MQIHLAQIDIHWHQPKRNLTDLSAQMAVLAPSCGDLVVLPEMFSTGFSMGAAEIAEPLEDGSHPAGDWLEAQAAASECGFVGGVATRDSDGFHNQALAVLPDGAVARYRKHQGFSPAGETEAYRGGDTLTTFDWGGGRIGLTICYDLRFPELYRALAFAGAELILNIANWPRRRIDHWVALLRARAIENQCYVAGVNRVGEDPTSRYVGRSLVVDPHGEIVADAGEDAGYASAQIDFERVRSWRSEFPALADARRANPAVEHFAAQG